MIDMLYLCSRLTKSEYDETFAKLQSYLKKNFSKHQLRKDKRDRHTYVTNAFSKTGIQEIRLRKAASLSIEVRFRPRLLLDSNGYYKLIELTEFSYVEMVFNHILQDNLALPVPKLYEWKAKRFEAAIDVQVGEELVPKYIQLFKKGNVPDYFFDNKQTCKYWDSKTNVYLMASKLTVNWYDRYRTLQVKETKARKKYADFSETKGILRFETQIRSCNELLGEILNQDRLKKEVMKFYKQIVGEEDYYSMDKAIAIIDNSVGNQTKSLDLKRILMLIDKSGSISEAKKNYIKSKDIKTASDKFSKRINQLRKLGINPVVLPKEWGISHLENLYNKIAEGLN